MHQQKSQWPYKIFYSEFGQFWLVIMSRNSFSNSAITTMNATASVNATESVRNEYNTSLPLNPTSHLFALSRYLVTTNIYQSSFFQTEKETKNVHEEGSRYGFSL